MPRPDFPNPIYLVDVGQETPSLELETDPAEAKRFPYRQRYKSAPEHGVDWERLARAETHPLRVSILEALAADGGSVRSPVELAREWGQEGNLIAYHVRQLFEAGLIRLVDSRPRRGALEHFYGLAGEGK